mmetsp:Transcript_49648/g.106057  ORF Transcript_49648/g.106057 Transcript_49648/m.106057 type:complete len:318 (-) Transcript_49648:878-1831(-)
MSSSVVSYFHNRTLWSAPAVAKNFPSEERATACCSPMPLLDASRGVLSCVCQNDTRLSCPTETSCVASPASSKNSAIELIPPIGCCNDTRRTPAFRSHIRIERSREADSTLESSGVICSDVTGIECCLRCRIMSRVRISHARTSPFSPPVTRNLTLFAHTSAVTPPRCASSMVHRSWPSSASCARSLPSSQPVKMTSPEKQTHVGFPVFVTWHSPLVKTVYVLRSHNRIVPSAPVVTTLEGSPGAKATAVTAPQWLSCNIWTALFCGMSSLTSYMKPLAVPASNGSGLMHRSPFGWREQTAPDTCTDARMRKLRPSP